MSDLCDDVGASASEGTFTISTTQDDAGKIMNTLIIEMLILGEIECVAHSARSVHQLVSTVYLFAASAWIYLPAFCFFMLCPEVTWFDTTSHSNNKGVCFLTF